MATILLIANLAVLVSVAVVGWLIRHHIPAYLQEKGKNLATKEDIAEITAKVEGVRNKYTSEIERLRTDLQKELETYRVKVQAETELLQRSRIAQSETRVEIYRQVSDIVSNFLADIERPDFVGSDRQDQFNRNWFRAYCYLALFAPAAVMRTLDNLAEYVTQTANWGRRYSWEEFYPIWYEFINEMRRDLGLNLEPIGDALYEMRETVGAPNESAPLDRAPSADSDQA